MRENERERECAREKMTENERMTKTYSPNLADFAWGNVVTFCQAQVMNSENRN